MIENNYETKKILSEEKNHQITLTHWQTITSAILVCWHSLLKTINFYSTLDLYNSEENDN